MTVLRWVLAPPAFAVSLLLYPWCVVAAYRCRVWADYLDDAALAMAGHDHEQQ